MADVKFACAAWGFREMELPEFFQASKGMGIDFVEINLAPNIPNHLSPEATEAEMDMKLRQADDAGVKIVALAGGSNFAAPDLDGQLASVKHQIDLTVRMGAEVLRIFGGWVKTWQYTDEHFATVSRALAEVGEYAAERGVSVSMENHGGMTATGAQCRRLLSDAAAGMPVSWVAKPLGLNYDPANFRHAGEDALSALMVTSDLINYSHWKDVRYEGEEPEYCAVGEGVIDWAPIVQAITRNGFDGYWAIEYEEPSDVVRGTRDSLEHLRGLL